MNTQYIKINKLEEIGKAAKAAGEILRCGGLVAFPTETVYGLGANALDEEAAAKIYAAKGRPSDNPLIVHIAKTEALEEIAMEIPEQAYKIADEFWPGPLTIILRKKEIVPAGTTGGLETVAVRMPDHPLALEIIKAGGGFVAAPSANTSGRPSPTTAAHVKEDMSGKIEMILDGGEVGIGLESTIIDMSAEEPVILRPGYITKEMLEKYIGDVEIDQSFLGNNKESEAPKAPGMKYKHYAPKAPLVIVNGNVKQVTEYINKQAEAGSKKTGIICTEETKHNYTGGIIKVIGSRADEASIARNLYSILREFDHEDAEAIYTEAFFEQKNGQAVMNRLSKAAGYKIINV